MPALLTKGVTLSMCEHGGTLATVANLTNYPDLGGTSASHDVTLLSNKNHTYIPGLPDSSGVITFDFIYEPDTMKKFSDASEAYTYMDFCVELPDNGTATGSKFTWSGYVGSYTFNGKGPDEVMTFSADITVSTDFTITYRVVPTP